MSQLFMAAIIDGSSIRSGCGLSKNPHPWMQAYSSPERLMPRSWTTCPRPGPSTRTLPRTRRSGPAVATPARPLRAATSTAPPQRPPARLAQPSRRRRESPEAGSTASVVGGAAAAARASRRRRRLSRWRLTCTASSSAHRLIECSISPEQSRARSVTPFRCNVASATWESAIAGLRSTDSSTSSSASSETCLETFPKRLATCSLISSETATLRPFTWIRIDLPPEWKRGPM